MATSRARFQAHVDNLPDGDFPVNLAWVSATAVGTRLSNQTLAIGDNTFIPTAGTTVVVIVPPTNNTTDITIKGDTGDTGWDLQPALPNAVTWKAGKILLNVAIAVTGVDVMFI